MRIFQNKGFTLIEVILIILILGVGITGVSVLFAQGALGSAQSEMATIGLSLAQNQMEEISSKCWDESETSVSPCKGAVSASLPLDSEGEGRGAFDDADDFNGVSNTPPQDSQGTSMAAFSSFTRTVEVWYVNAASMDSFVGGPTDYKRISVTVAWGGSGAQVQLVKVISNHD